MSTNIESDAIAAMCNENRGIAKNNALPWSVSNDYEYFKRVVRTTRDEGKINAMIIGRLSWESLSIDERPILPGLTVIISSKMSNSDIVMSKDAKPDSVVVLKSIDQAVEYIKANYSDRVETIYSLGGSEIYRESLKSLRRFYLTRIFGGSFDCDVFLQPANFLDGFRLMSREELTDEERLFKCQYNTNLIQPENGIKYRFEVYEKIK